jgi:hypothetical protein
LASRGAPKTDTSTPEAFKAAMLNAKSVAYPNPAGGGLSGIYFAQIAEKMEYAEQLKSKAKFPADDFAGKLVASGEAEFAIQQEAGTGFDWKAWRFLGRFPRTSLSDGLFGRRKQGRQGKRGFNGAAQTSRVAGRRHCLQA